MQSHHQRDKKFILLCMYQRIACACSSRVHENNLSNLSAVLSQNICLSQLTRDVLYIVEKLLLIFITKTDLAEE